jgi:hypothetical protein
VHLSHFELFLYESLSDFLPGANILKQKKSSETAGISETFRNSRPRHELEPNQQESAIMGQAHKRPGGVRDVFGADQVDV